MRMARFKVFSGLGLTLATMTADVAARCTETLDDGEAFCPLWQAITPFRSLPAPSYSKDPPVFARSWPFL